MQNVQTSQQPQQPQTYEYHVVDKKILTPQESVQPQQQFDREEEDRRREAEIASAIQHVEMRQEVPMRDRDNMTVLEKHVEFFDRNKDGFIYPWETFEGFRVIGFGYILSAFATFIIHLFFPPFANRSLIPFPRLRIDVSMIHKCKHGSDAEVYDHFGKMDNEKLDELFRVYSDRPDSIPVRNLFWSMTNDKWEAFDFFGFWAEKLEWGFFVLLVATDDWRIRREDIEAQYDGSLFYKLERERKLKAA
jgi:peroxygenase